MQTFGGGQGVLWESESSELESFRFEDQDEVQVKVFVRILKKGHPESFILLFFPPKKLVRLSILNQVKSSPDCKMIKFLTFNNLFPPLRHSR